MCVWKEEGRVFMTMKKKKSKNSLLLLYALFKKTKKSGKLNHFE